MRHVVISIGLLVLGLAPLHAAEGGGGASLADLAWMAGSWASDEGGKRSEEHWTSPAGGMMLGLHRDVVENKGAFEFYWREGESLCAAVEGPMNGETVSERWCWPPASLR